MDTEAYSLIKHLPKGKYKIKSANATLKFPYRKFEKEGELQPFALELLIGNKIVPVDIATFNPKIYDNPTVMRSLSDGSFEEQNVTIIVSPKTKNIPIVFIWRKNDEVFYFLNTRHL